MGIIRLLLALSVVIAHSHSVFGNKLVGGVIAVQTFYIISGFYMALILNEKYIHRQGSYKLFISNRFLRLYPVYFVMLVLTLLLCIAASLFGNHGAGRLQVYFDHYQQLNPFSFFYLLFSNIFLFGQDLIMFMGLDKSTGNFYFTSDFSQSDPQLWSFLLIPQAWTIAIELLFYLIAPFIVRRSVGLIMALIASSLLFRIVLYSFGYQNDPWTYRFFPLELAFFLTGAICYKMYKVVEKKEISKVVHTFIFFILLSSILFFEYIPLESVYKKWIFYALFAFFLPFLFIFTKDKKWDGKIGELSYPVYISHVFVFMFFGYMHKYLKITESYIGIAVILGAILLSLLLAKYIIEPIEQIRQKRIKQSNYIK